MNKTPILIAALVMLTAAGSAATTTIDPSNGSVFDVTEEINLTAGVDTAATGQVYMIVEDNAGADPPEQVFLGNRTSDTVSQTYTTTYEVRCSSCDWEARAYFNATDGSGIEEYGNWHNFDTQEVASFTDPTDGETFTADFSTNTKEIWANWSISSVEEFDWALQFSDDGGISDPWTNLTTGGYGGSISQAYSHLEAFDRANTDGGEYRLVLYPRDSGDVYRGTPAPSFILEEPQPTYTWGSPTAGETFLIPPGDSTTQVPFEFSVSHPSSGTAAMRGTTDILKSYPGAASQLFTENMTLPSGTYTYNYEFTSDDSGNTYPLDSRTFSVNQGTEDSPEITLYEPDNGSTFVETDVTHVFEVNSSFSSTWSIEYSVGSTGPWTTKDTGNLTAGRHNVTTTIDPSLGQNSTVYWRSTVQSDQTGSIYTSGTRSYEFVVYPPDYTWSSPTDGETFTVSRPDENATVSFEYGISDPRSGTVLLVTPNDTAEFSDGYPGAISQVYQHEINLTVGTYEYTLKFSDDSTGQTYTLETRTVDVVGQFPILVDLKIAIFDILEKQLGLSETEARGLIALILVSIIMLAMAHVGDDMVAVFGGVMALGLMSWIGFLPDFIVLALGIIAAGLLAAGTANFLGGD